MRRVGWIVGAGLVVVMPALAPVVAHGSAGAGTGSDGPVSMVAVGDIACDPDSPAFNGGQGTSAGCRQQAVGDAVRAAHPDVFAPLGDNQYLDGTYAKFMGVYDKAFGDLKSISRPIPGNHEYKTPYGAGYYKYFGAAAHQESAGTYSYDLGAWHVLAINSTQCDPTHSCGPGTSMAKWIAADVAAHPSQCLMAMWHHPVYSAGAHGDYAPMVPVWNQLNSYGADVVLNGHDHMYQRFQPLGAAALTPDGHVAAPTVRTSGMVEFVVGTGGEDNYDPSPTTDPGVAAALAAAGSNPNPAIFGALQLGLGAGSYSWNFLPAQGTTFADSGSTGCRAKTPPVGVPAVPAAVQVARAGDGRLAVSWNPAQASGTPTVTYTASVVGSGAKCVTTASTCTISGLVNGRSYQVVVKASNTVGEITSPPSAPIIAAMAPSRPQAPAVVVRGSDAVVSWTPSALNGGLPDVRYVVSTATDPDLPCTSRTATSCTLVGLPPGKYRFGVAARTDAGTSGVVGLAAVPVGLPAAPAAALPARAGSRTVSVAITAASAVPSGPVADAPSSYRVVAMPSAKSCVAVVPASSCTITGLTNGTAYSFTATAENAAGSSTPTPASAPLRVGRAPAQPGTPTATAIGSGAVALAWGAPADFGLAISGYEVVANGAVVCRSTTPTCTVTGLTVGKKYAFTVTAINEAGRSINSGGSNLVVIR